MSVPDEESRMANIHPAHWLSEYAKAGLKELPSNAAWLLSKAAQPAESAGTTAEEKTSEVKASAREKMRGLRDSVIEAVPGSGEDSVGSRMRRARHEDSPEARMSRAHEAAEDAQEAEDEALALAEEAQRRSEHARAISEECREQVEAAKKDGD